MAQTGEFRFQKFVKFPCQRNAHKDRHVNTGQPGQRLAGAGKSGQLSGEIGIDHREAGGRACHQDTCADAGGHAEGIGVKKVQRSDDGSHKTEENGPHHTADHIDRKASLCLRSVRSVNVGDECQIALTVDGVGRADRLALQTQQKGEGQSEEDSPQVSDLLEQQGGPCGDDGLKAGAGVDPEFGDEWTDGDDDQLGRCLDFLFLENFQNLRPGKYAQDQRVEDREQDQSSRTCRDLDLANGVGDHNTDKRKQEDLIFVPKAFQGGRIQIGFFFHDRLLCDFTYF